MEKIDEEIINRLWSKVKKTDYCWNWIGGKHRQGYGFISVYGKDKLAHRISFLLNFGKLPKNKMVCHRCDNPSCVRPDHLFVGTQKDNMMDMIKKGRQADNRGEKNVNSILNNKKVKQIKKLLSEKKLSYLQIAKKFGVKYGTINNIKSGYAWKTVN